jgi:hypothetical protein
MSLQYLEVVAAEKYDTGHGTGPYEELTIDRRYRYKLRPAGRRAARTESKWVDSRDMTEDEKSLYFFMANDRNLILPTMEQFSDSTLAARKDLYDKHVAKFKLLVEKDESRVKKARKRAPKAPTPPPVPMPPPSPVHHFDLNSTDSSSDEDYFNV